MTDQKEFIAARNNLARRIDTSLAKQFAQHFVGFDDIFSAVNGILKNEVSVSNFPPRNVIRFDENHFQLQFAVAGYEKDELEVSVVRQNVLRIAGNKKEVEESGTYLYQGIAFRQFSHETTIPENSEVSVKLQNGLLIIDIRKQVTEPSVKVFDIL